MSSSRASQPDFVRAVSHPLVPVCALVAASAFLNPSRVFAQQQAPAVSAANVREARAAFEAGVTALDEGRFRDAIEHLEHSRSLREASVVNYNLGLAYRGVGDIRAALTAFQRYLDAPDSRTARDEIDAVRHTVAELRAMLATLTVHATPPEATILLDGHPLENAWNGAIANPGAHVLEVSAEGFRTERRDVTLARGERRTIELALQNATGPAHLVIAPSVSTAMVSVDGVRQPTSTVDIALPPGDHLVAIDATGYEHFDRRVHLGRSGELRIEARLERSGRPRWIVPVGIAAGVVVIAGVVTGVVLATQPRQGDTSGLPHSIGTWVAQ